MIKRLKALYKKKFIRDISWMLSANILIKPFQIVKSYFVARYLGPEQYGILKSVELIQMLNKFGDLGFVNTAIRDSGELIGSKNKEKLEQVKSVCYSSEIVLVFILFTIALLIFLATPPTFSAAGDISVITVPTVTSFLMINKFFF